MSPCLHPLVRTGHLHRHLLRTFTLHLPCPQSPFLAPHLLPLPNTSSTAPQSVFLPGFTLSSNAFSSACTLDPGSLSFGYGNSSSLEELVFDRQRRPSLDVWAFSTRSFASAPGLDAPAASNCTETAKSESERFFKDLCGPKDSSVEENRGRLSSIVEKALSSDYTDSAEHVTERALMNKIQSLKELGFTDSQILNAVENLSVNVTDIATFAHLTSDRLSFVYQFLIQFGIRPPQSRRLLERVPSIFLHDKEHLESTGRAWERLLGDRLIVIRSFKLWPETLLVSEPELEEASEHLQSKVGDKATLCTLLRNNPKAVCYSKEAMERAAEILLELGIKEGEVGRFLATHPFLLEGHPPQIVQSAKFLRGQGLQDEVIRRLLRSCPKVLRPQGTMRLSQSFRALEKHGFIGDELNKFLSSKPTILKFPVSKILAHNKEVLKKLGLQEHSPLMKQSLQQSFRRNVNQRIKVFVDAGMEHETARKLFMDNPFLMALSTKELRTKVDFLLNTMHKTREEIVSCPLFISCGLESKIKPRFRVIQWLRSIGELQEDVPIWTYVAVSKEDFFEQFVNRHPEGLAIYNGEVQEVAECAES